MEVKAIAREAGSRSKIAVAANDDHIDPVGSLVGQRGVRVSTVMSELGGEKIDVIEWSPDSAEFIEDALSPAQVLKVTILEEAGTGDEDNRGHAQVEVAPDQQSLAIGRGGQNVRLAAKLTGWKIDIVSIGGETPAQNDKSEALSDEAVTEEPEELAREAGGEDRDIVADDRKEEASADNPEEFEEQMEEAEQTKE